VIVMPSRTKLRKGTSVGNDKPILRYQLVERPYLGLADQLFLVALRNPGRQEPWTPYLTFVTPSPEVAGKVNPRIGESGTAPFRCRLGITNDSNVGIVGPIEIEWFGVDVDEGSYLR
jgi:hypothetical protein